MILLMVWKDYIQFLPILTRGGGQLLDFWNGGPVVMCLFGVWNSMSQMCYLWSEICSGRDYLGSNISSMSLSNPFLSIKFVFKTGQLIIWGLWISWSDYLGVWENCLTLAPPFQNSRSSPGNYKIIELQGDLIDFWNVCCNCLKFRNFMTLSLTMYRVVLTFDYLR